jgi:hypothetical protein
MLLAYCTEVSQSYKVFPKHIDAFCAILAHCSYKEVQMTVDG